MNRLSLFSLAALGALTTSLAAPCGAAPMGQFRPPAVPLVAHDPYFSIWSENDHLTDGPTRHWTHREHSLSSLIRVDGQVFRIMGTEPATVPALPQVSVQVTPTRSIYDFENEKVHVNLTFLTPALPDDLDVLARPVTYLTWSVRSVDGAQHAVQIYDGTSSQLTVNSPDQPVEWKREAMGGLMALRVGTAEQPYLATSGDDTRVDWGYAYAVAPSNQATFAIGANDVLLNAFATNGRLPAADDTREPRAVSDAQPVMGIAFDVGKVGKTTVERQVMLGYDEVWAIKYYGQRLRPYWRRNGATPATLFAAAAHDYPTLLSRCVAFDRDLTADETRVGGDRYAAMCNLAYRQCLAANGFAADSKGQPLYFTKENTSNGDIATVDVFFPEAPQLLFLSPALMKASLVSTLDYAASSHWKFPNAPHDLGTYPVVAGRDDGGEGMPVEESGNMLLICDAITQIEGKPDFVAKWWPQLTQWENYLEKYGNDPEDQLCTDDFMGHLAHNSNLSIKAILAIAAYGDMAKMRGDTATATRVQTLAKGYAQHWMQVADAGDHSLLAFDRPNTWSQKYNLVWDKLLGLNVFPNSVAQREVAYYKTVLQPYGVPLDSRTKVTKSDWSVWSATLADSQADFETITSPIYSYLNQTKARSPFPDSYVTDNVNSDGMHARPVIGGVFVKMLSDRATWKKWAMRGDQKIGPWAILPPPPIVQELVATSQKQKQVWHYTTEKPSDAWTTATFDDTAWKQGPGSFGTRGTPGSAYGTEWNTPDIWLRRQITLPAGNNPNMQFWVDHDEDVQIYVNGVLAAKEAGFNSAYSALDILPAARPLLRPGTTVTIAVHCHQTGGGQNIDVGLANVTQPKGVQ